MIGKGRLETIGPGQCAKLPTVTPFKGAATGSPQKQGWIGQVGSPELSSVWSAEIHFEGQMPCRAGNDIQIQLTC